VVAVAGEAVVGVVEADVEEEVVTSQATTATTVELQRPILKDTRRK
jgi:hypothetical protein